MDLGKIKKLGKHPALRYPLGVVFIILGVLGLFLPVLQGLLFLAIGLYLLGIRPRFVDRFIKNRQKKRERAGSNEEQINPDAQSEPHQDETPGSHHERTTP